MAKPGPKPGAKKALQLEQAHTAPAGAAGPSPIPSPGPVLSAQDRENPNKLTGEALRALANRRGLSRSELERMSDDKIREQLRYVTQRQYEADDAVV
jgi:hypothetical protein